MAQNVNSNQPSFQKSKRIQKSEFNTFLQKLEQDFTLFLPKKTKTVDSFEKYEGNIDNFSTFQNTRIPPKKILFPQNEKLFSYKKTGDQVEIIKNEEEKDKNIIVGIRICDARSFSVLDTFFASGKYQDTHYLNRRKNTLLIGLACNTPASTCFCTSVGGDPYSSEGLDALLIDIGDSYLITITSQSGEILTDYLDSYPKAPKKYSKILQEQATQARNLMNSPPDITNIKENLDKLFENNLWEEVSQSCISCGSCSFICPTCHCFDIQDENTKTGGERVRIWDHCQSSIFTLETSGHNPRKSGRERTRQRVYHKFNYYLKNYSILGCIGCGRCIRACPAGQDIRRTLTSIQKISQQNTGGL